MNKVTDYIKSHPVESLLLAALIVGVCWFLYNKLTESKEHMHNVHHEVLQEEEEEEVVAAEPEVVHVAEEKEPDMDQVVEEEETVEDVDYIEEEEETVEPTQDEMEYDVEEDEDVDDVQPVEEPVHVVPEEAAHVMVEEDIPQEEVLPVLPPQDTIQHVLEMVEPEEETLRQVAEEVVREQQTCKPKRIDNEATKALKKSVKQNKTRRYIDNLSDAAYSALDRSQNSSIGKKWVDESKLIMRAQTAADRYEDHEQNFSLLSDLPNEVPAGSNDMCKGKTWKN